MYDTHPVSDPSYQEIKSWPAYKFKENSGSNNIMFFRSHLIRFIIKEVHMCTPSLQCRNRRRSFSFLFCWYRLYFSVYRVKSLCGICTFVVGCNWSCNLTSSEIRIYFNVATYIVYNVQGNKYKHVYLSL